MSVIEVRKPKDDELKNLGVNTWGIWTCEPSSFDWTYADKEVCYLLEGRVTVKAGNATVTFGKGDLVTFPKGLSCHWTVHEAVRKHYRFE